MSDQTIEQRLDEILDDIRIGHNKGVYTGSVEERAKQAFLQLLNEARIDEGSHFVILSDGVKHQVVYQLTRHEYLTRDERIAQLTPKENNK